MNKTFIIIFALMVGFLYGQNDVCLTNAQSVDEFSKPLSDETNYYVGELQKLGEVFASDNKQMLTLTNQLKTETDGAKQAQILTDIEAMQSKLLDEKKVAENFKTVESGKFKQEFDKVPAEIKDCKNIMNIKMQFDNAYFAYFASKSR